MSRVYGFMATDPTRLDCSLVEAQNALVVQSDRDRIGKRHADGWGIARWHDDTVEVTRSTLPAFADRQYADVAASVESHAVIAHVRTASVGPVLLENTHPFSHGPWTLAHNGTISAFEHVRTHLDLGFYAPAWGDTDSETVFRWILNQMADYGLDPDASSDELDPIVARRFVLVDHDEVETSNLNRLIGATPADIGERKVTTAKRLIDAIQPGGHVTTVDSRIDSSFDMDLLARVDVVFGCVDNDSARLRLTEFTSRSQLPYVDLASDTGHAGDVAWFGGRVFLASEGDQCLSCAGELDQTALALDSMDPAQLAADERIYGVDRSMLEGGGPMVVSVNGVVASLGVTEFIALVTGLRRPNPHLVYRGDRGIVTLRTDQRSGSCYYCDTLWRNR